MTIREFSQNFTLNQKGWATLSASSEAISQNGLWTNGEIQLCIDGSCTSHKIGAAANESVRIVESRSLDLAPGNHVWLINHRTFHNLDPIFDHAPPCWPNDYPRITKTFLDIIVYRRE